MCRVSDQVETEILDLANYLSLIEDEEMSTFEEEIHRRLDRIAESSLAVPESRPNLMRFCFQACGEELDKSIIHRHCRQKPAGFPGDHQIIDWIYTERSDSQGVGGLWDAFAHRQAVSESARNRKHFFCDLYETLCKQVPNGLSVLNLGSGPCRDVAEAIVQAGSKRAKSHFHCVDMDERAIPYAKNVVRGLKSEASFTWEVSNVFWLDPGRQYDLVWAAGLFDYLEEPYAIALLKRMWDWTRDGGRLVVGNIHPRNPTRHYMEWCLEWLLIHRREEEMAALCEQAGIPQSHVVYTQEPLGIFTFCLVQKG